MFETMRLGVLRDLEMSSVSNLDLPFTHKCQMISGNRDRRRPTPHVNKKVLTENTDHGHPRKK